MPRLKKRVNSDAYYVHHSFRNDHLLIRMTYQATPEAEDRLFAVGIRDGDSIPADLFNLLVAEGDLYTGKGGAAVEVDLDSPENQSGGLFECSTLPAPQASIPRTELSDTLPTTCSPELCHADGRLLQYREFYTRFPHHEHKAVSKAYDKVRRSFYRGVQQELRRLLEAKKIYRVEELGGAIILHCVPRNPRRKGSEPSMYTNRSGSTGSD